MRNLCFIAAADEGYEQFVPAFLYSISVAYPEASARVFLGSPGTGISDAMELVPSKKLKLVPDAFAGYASQGRSPAMWRFLTLAPKHSISLEGFRYYYITDVDFTICREEPTLARQHRSHCNVLGLTYSGHIRRYVPKLVCGRFFFGQVFFSQVARVAAMYDLLVKDQGEDVFKNEPRHPDEHLLYRIIGESGLRELPILASFAPEDEHDLMDPEGYSGTLFNPHHGVHLGIGRGKVARIVERYGALLERPFYRRYLEHLFELYADPTFRKILNKTPNAGLLKETLRKMLEVASCRYLYAGQY